jgi:hypothetical protein
MFSSVDPTEMEIRAAPSWCVVELGEYINNRLVQANASS